MSRHNNAGILPDVLLDEANGLIQKLSKEQVLWLGGYLSGVGLNGSDNHAVAQQAVVSNNHEKISTNIKILLGSHSGNGKLIAQAISKQALVNKHNVETISMADYKPKNLRNEENLIVIVSTHGEGEPPVDAEDLHRFLGGKRVGDLSNLNYGVIALGDSSYKFFCQTGIDFNDRLKKNGAKPIAEPFLLDLDFKEQIPSVAKELLDKFASAGNNTRIAEAGNDFVIEENGLVKAELIDKVLLNGKGSQKETWHIELDLEGKGLKYQPGDSLEVYAINKTSLVDGVLQQLQLTGSELVYHNDEQLTVKEALLIHKEITVITMPVLSKLSAYVTEPDLNRLLDNRDELDVFLEGSDLLDVLNEFQFEISAQDLINTLRTLPPRAYSIASSQAEVDDEVHLTIGAVRYQKNQREHNGVCSTYLVDDLQEGDELVVRLKPNERFRLPHKDTDIILIGAGTGVAPYRSFIQQRAIDKGTGRNWLFFGDQHFETDFLYQSEWLKYRQQNILSKVDVAFSRDQKEKIYVQHRLKEKADEVYQWLSNGAVIYICGDRKNMARDVQQALVEIISQKEGISITAAEEKLSAFRKSGRLQEDVY